MNPLTTAVGAKLLYFWNPVDNSWNVPALPVDQTLHEERWYPTVTVLPPEINTNADMVLISGGVSATPDGETILFPENYETWILPDVGAIRPAWEGQWHGTTWPGPTGGADYALGMYPRIHALSSREAVTSGFSRGMARLLHQSATTPFSSWDLLDKQSVDDRTYNGSVLFPELPPFGPNIVMSIGGNTSSGPTASVEVSRADAAALGTFPTGWDWVSLPNMNLTFARVFPNAVLLPDSTVLVVGGDEGGANLQGTITQPAMDPELYENGAWRTLARQTRVRNYHSTAILLPSGKVLVGGGEARRFDPNPPYMPLPMGEEADYEVYVPPYIASGKTRPVITLPSVAGTLSIAYGGQYTIQFETLPFGKSIQSAVLMAPGSATHQHDMSQRLVKLQIDAIQTGEEAGEGESVNTLTFTAPSPRTVPRGYYMLFLVSNEDIPSEARWVRLQ